MERNISDRSPSNNNAPRIINNKDYIQYKKFKPNYIKITHPLYSQLTQYIGYTTYQARIISSQLIHLLYYGFQMNFLNLILKPYTEYTQLSKSAIIVVNTSIYLGFAVGSLSIKYQYLLTNNRLFLIRLNFLIGMIMTFIFSMSSSISILIITRLIIGVSVGFNYPVHNNLVSEILPYKTKYLVFISLLSMNHFSYIVTLAFELLVIPSLKPSGVVELLLSLCSFYFILYCVFLILSVDSFVNLIGNENRSKGFGLLRYLISRVGLDEDDDRSVCFNKELRDNVEFEIKYPVVSLRMKLKRLNCLRNIEMDNNDIKDKDDDTNIRFDDHEKMIESESCASSELAKTNKDDLNNNNSSIKLRREEINKPLITKLDNRFVPYILPNKNNYNNKDKNEDKDKDNDEYREIDNAITEIPHITTSSNLFDKQYLKISVANIILISGYYFINYGFQVLSNKITHKTEAYKQASNWSNSAIINEIINNDNTNYVYNYESAVSSIRDNIILNLVSVFSPFLAAILANFRVIGIKWCLISGYFILIAFLICLIANEENMIVYVAIINGVNTFISCLIYTLIAQCYSVEMSDRSAGVCYLIGKIFIILSVIFCLALEENLVLCFVIFLVIAVLGLLVSIFYPDIIKNKITTEE